MTRHTRIVTIAIQPCWHFGLPLSWMMMIDTEDEYGTADINDKEGIADIDVVEDIDDMYKT